MNMICDECVTVVSVWIERDSPFPGRNVIGLRYSTQYQSLSVLIWILYLFKRRDFVKRERKIKRSVFEKKGLVRYRKPKCQSLVCV